ncbi:HEAT repeat domain-containing protein [Leucobacter ruminantium]|uniref:HEAT repeat domain-containing protein n=1 Tax=Leucobacter ruminantium TaxID=1289170 RepID=A0A939LTX9_9MICO|nr:HEAT repeat domain-containing protein [Leucobacter ruminantium]MBO1804296.1 HEAT repeat domain-containing protein [Leucobacter ruminantium]
MTETGTTAANLAAALSADESSARLQAALTAGTHPDDAYLEPLIERCAVEPDFYVRDMLTWALTRLSPEIVLPRVLEETRSDVPQARSQALHTLSKLGDERGWHAITPAHLHDADDEVARAAWRTAAGLAPLDTHADLAREFSRELGRGDLDVKRSLSRAFVELGEDAIPALQAVTIDAAHDSETAQHARATLRLIEDPEATFVLE